MLPIISISISLLGFLISYFLTVTYPQVKDNLYQHMSPPVTVSCLANAGGLQRRYIQKCKISDLYWQFQAEWATLSEAHEQFGRDIPSYDTFRRRWNSHWCGMLHMREKSQHKQCQICFDLQLCLHSPTVPLSTKMEAAKTLRRHQAEQYEDRMLYWSLRFASQAQSHGMSEDPLPACGSSSVLTIIIDDMDHSKFAWPKFPFRKSPAEMENLIRPTVTFTGAIAHGWGTYLYMANPNVMGGSDYFCEVLCQTIQNVGVPAIRLTVHSPTVLQSGAVSFLHTWLS